MRTIEIQAIDPHVHLRDFGESHKEDLDSGTKAAIAGGYTVVLDMPNNTPPVISQSALFEKLDVAKEKVNTYYGAYIVGTAKNSKEVAKASYYAAGLKLYMDTTHGNLFVRDLGPLVEHFYNWNSLKPICVHAEDFSLSAAIGLASIYKKPLHVCHVSQKSEIEMIKHAKESGLPITCEVTPHHLFLTEDDLEYLGPMGGVKPQLRTQKDVNALWENLEVIDCIASDHAPHTVTEKNSTNPPPGFPGLETTLPLMLSAVTERRLTIDRLMEMVHTNPKKIFHIPDLYATYALIDLEESYYLDPSTLQTKSAWSPFIAHKLTGRVREVFVGGQKVYKEGKFLPRNNKVNLLLNN